MNRNKLYDENRVGGEIPDALKKDFIVETGNAYGVDFSAKYEKKTVECFHGIFLELC